MKKTGAWLVVNALEQLPISHTFGVPGVHNTEIYDGDSVITSNIYGSNLYLNSNNINIGNQTSLIHINGTVNNILTNNLRVRDKFINLNYNESTNTGFDTGNLCGINILTNNSTTSYIRTSDDASRYELKTPSDITSKYIL